MLNKRIAILGAGSWGTALAILAARNGCRVLLWGHNPAHIAALQQQRQNQRYLPGIDFPDNIMVTSELAAVTQFSSSLLVCVPSHVFKSTLCALKPYCPPDITIAWATKGFNPDDGALLHEVVANLFGSQIPAAILSGPTFAREVAADLPTAITIAANQSEFGHYLSLIFHSERFRTYTSSDLIGVEVGGAVKNVLAIAAGIADGLGFGANTRAALIARGLTEIIRLGVQLGGRQETFMGLAGLGDLILTCTDNQSRNRRFGLALGQGKNRAAIIQSIGQEVEGIAAAKETYLLSIKHNIEMPIALQTYKVLYENLAPQVAVQNLLSREQKSEA